MVTETLYAPGIVDSINTFLEENGMLVLEAEKGAATDGFGGQQWLSQTVQAGFAGESYLRAMPDIGARTEANELQGSPMLSYRIESNTPTTYTVWVRGMASDAAGDSLHVGLDDAAAATADNLTGFQPNEWTWSRTTSDGVDANLDLSVTGTYTLNVWMREDGLRLDRLLLVTDTTYIPTGEGPAATPIQVMTDTVEPGLTSHVIQYAYDDVYRLTDAVYTGDIEADYHYGYDPVGNMTAYTETVGTQTTRVTRFFDNANRLQGAFDYDAGTTSYLYDNNGNLTLVMPPGDAQWLHYSFDQRNLLISHTVSISGTNVQPVATFAYDGNGNRVQQTDSSGSEPVTTTYINDVVGLTQVLAADDGTEQVYNLFGLDLISQDDGINSRHMLVDGLGSVRTEMADGIVESVITYDPYGNLLKQVGDTGTTYGFTGEQQDNSTGLLYLRARYYNPALRSFMGQDPWSGNGGRPQSINGWSYVDNNPANLIDYTGMFPEHCRNASSYPAYGDCVRDAYGVYYEHGDYDEFFSEYLEGTLPEPDTDGCYEGPVPYRAPGYLEGFGGNFNFVFWYAAAGGREIVYDFATMERVHFKFHKNNRHYKGGWDPMGSTTYMGGGAVWYYGQVNGLRSWGSKTDRDDNKHTSLIDDYRGEFWATSYGVNAEEIGSKGVTVFEGVPDNTIYGVAYYTGNGLGLSFPIDYGQIWTLYEEGDKAYRRTYFTFDPNNGGKSVDPEVLYSDLKTGIRGFDMNDIKLSGLLITRKIWGYNLVHKYAGIYNGINHESYQ